MIEVHADGACSGNPGRGGWAVLIRSLEGVREFVGSAADTTNNRMELQAAIEGLRAVPTTSPVTLFSDSEYLIKGMTEWIAGWKQRNWQTAARKTVENRDLWEILDSLAGGRVTWLWVRGHARNPDNERVNALAQRAARGDRPGNVIGGDAASAPFVGVAGDGGSPAVAFPCYLSLVSGVAARHASWESCKARTEGRPAKTKKCKSLTEVQDILRAWQLPPALPEEWPGAGAVLTPSPVTPRQPQSRLFARGVVDRARSWLEGAGFRPRTNAGPTVCFDLVRGSAIAIGYTTGRLQAQGNWTELDLRDWAKLAEEEQGWIRSTVDAAPRCPTMSSFSWTTEVCRYLFIHLSAGSLQDWSAEPIGRYLVVREVETGRAVGLLSPCAWRRLLPEAGEAIARSIHDRRWYKKGRECVVVFQDQSINLTVVSLSLSRAAGALAGLWDWEAAIDAEVHEQRRIAGQIQPLLECHSKRWCEAEWRQATAGLGNQVDVLVEWVRQTLAPGRAPAVTSGVRPLEVIGQWGGSEECAARLLEQRSAGELRFRSPLFEEERYGVAMALFLAKCSNGAQP